MLSLLAGCASEPIRPATYTVQRGDTLYAIAWRLRLDYRELARWNGIDDKYLIRPGQVLRLLPGASRPQQQVASAARAASKPVPVRPTPTPPMPPIINTPPVVAVRWQWPVDGGTATLTMRPNGGQGLVINGELGQPVRAAASGRVVYTGTGLLGYGQLLIIKHNESYLTAYGHIESVSVVEGDAVDSGQQVAAMGSGPQGAPLLYFEIRLNGTPGNPLLLLPQRS
jgi:lipoprotein NlpD